ncbi:SRPBCC family protein [Gallaecimonas mangrovi]|uniref:SRPBCC family protein n=1 Tax=Gallaecimonas mangrovi TaxID=2291597 RepID=UPI000E1FD4A0|nr:SRPBCC family protein [Gallaecimonas mangrovi]
MGWLKKAITALVVCIVALLVIGLFLPRDSQFARSISIKAPPEQIYATLTDLRQFNSWSPWYAGATASYQVTGKAAEPGQQLKWQQNDKTGDQGSMTLLESDKPGYVAFRLQFAGHDQADISFRIRQTANGSDVTWGYFADMGNDISDRYLGLVMEHALGPDFDKGLKALKKKEEENKPDDNG